MFGFACFLATIGMMCVGIWFVATLAGGRKMRTYTLRLRQIWVVQQRLYERNHADQALDQESKRIEPCEPKNGQGFSSSQRKQGQGKEIPGRRSQRTKAGTGSQEDAVKRTKSSISGSSCSVERSRRRTKESRPIKLRNGRGHSNKETRGCHIPGRIE